MKKFVLFLLFLALPALSHAQYGGIGGGGTPTCTGSTYACLGLANTFSQTNTFAGAADAAIVGGGGAFSAASLEWSYGGNNARWMFDGGNLKAVTNNLGSVPIEISLNLVSFPDSVQFGHLTSWTGLQVATGAGCTITSPAAGSFCEATITLPVTEPDTSYLIAGCSSAGATGPIALGQIDNLSTTQIEVQLVGMSSAATGGGTVACTVVHS